MLSGAAEHSTAVGSTVNFKAQKTEELPMPAAELRAWWRQWTCRWSSMSSTSSLREVICTRAVMPCTGGFACEFCEWKDDGALAPPGQQMCWTKLVSS